MPTVFICHVTSFLVSKAFQKHQYLFSTCPRSLLQTPRNGKHLQFADVFFLEMPVLNLLKFH